MRQSDLLDSADPTGIARYTALLQTGAASAVINQRVLTEYYAGPSSAIADISRSSTAMIAAVQSSAALRQSAAVTGAVSEFTKWFETPLSLGHTAAALRSQLAGWVERNELHDAAVFQSLAGELSRLAPFANVDRLYGAVNWHTNPITKWDWSIARASETGSEVAYAAFAQQHKGLNRSALRRLWAIAIQAIVKQRLAVARSHRSSTRTLVLLRNILFELLLRRFSTVALTHVVRWSDSLTHRRVLSFALRSGNPPPSNSPRSTEPHFRALGQGTQVNSRGLWPGFDQTSQGGCIS